LLVPSDRIDEALKLQANEQTRTNSGRKASDEGCERVRRCHPAPEGNFGLNKKAAEAGQNSALLN
jgi:hypothetical protein